MMGGLVLPAEDNERCESEDGDEIQQDYDGFLEWLDKRSDDVASAVPVNGDSATGDGSGKLPATASKPWTCQLCKKDETTCTWSAIYKFAVVLIEGCFMMPVK